MSATRPPAPPGAVLRRFASSFRPARSRAAAYRAVRATLVIPSLFALTSRVVDDPQMSTFAAFGGFATLVLAGFGGSRADKLRAHLALAVAGSVLLLVGTAVSGTTALAAGVALPVGFAVLFFGVLGPNAVSGATAVLLAYILPASSAGAMSTVPSRLAGWWLASATGTLAVLVLSPRSPADRLRAAASASAAALADQLEAAGSGTAATLATRSLEARAALIAAFSAAPLRPSGLGVPDQALTDLVDVLRWCTDLVWDAPLEKVADVPVAGADSRLLEGAAALLRDAAAVLSGGTARPLLAGLGALERASSSELTRRCRAGADSEEAVHLSFHARLIAAAARSVAVDALIAARRADPAVLAAERARWEGAPAPAAPRHRAAGALEGAGRVLRDHAGVRSVWFLNSARGALALAGAVAVADLTGVQHGFWVVLGALSVLRTSAASTGATALRALAGATAGLVLGGALILGIGGSSTALWAVLPFAVLVSAYAPATAPFAVGQAAFTVMISVLYNIVVPIGWKVGVVRVEDVALGVAVSAVAGVLFWPRGAGLVVGDDLGDAFHLGGLYLVQAVAWAVGLRPSPPDAGGGAIRASVQLDEALRAFTAEQGTKRIPKEELWRLVGGALQLRLTAQSLATLDDPDPQPEEATRALLGEAVRLAGVCDALAGEVGRMPATVAQELAKLPPLASPVGPYRGVTLWVRQHLDHLRDDLSTLGGAAELVGTSRDQPWWR